MRNGAEARWLGYGLEGGHTRTKPEMSQFYRQCFGVRLQWQPARGVPLDTLFLSLGGWCPLSPWTALCWVHIKEGNGPRCWPSSGGAGGLGPKSFVYHDEVDCSSEWPLHTHTPFWPQPPPPPPNHALPCPVLPPRRKKAKVPLFAKMPNRRHGSITPPPPLLYKLRPCPRYSGCRDRMNVVSNLMRYKCSAAT